MIQYVVGFMFTLDKNEVVLIRKNRPDWQAGKWNGVGGKCEDDETPANAMKREFLEETGVDSEEWEKYAMIYGDNNGWRVHVFRAFSNFADYAETKTDETIRLCDMAALPENQISNLQTLLAAALSDQKFTILEY